MTKWDNNIWVEWLKPRHALKDIYISPEAMKDIQHWWIQEHVHVDNITELTRIHIPEPKTKFDKNCDTFQPSYGSIAERVQFEHKPKVKTIIIVSGYYAPLHINHIEMMEAAKALGDELWVIVNNDKQLMKKKGFCFQNQQERNKIVSSLKVVDKTWVSEGDEDHIGWDISKWVAGSWPELWAGTKWIFANGGDRCEPHPKEAELCNILKIEMVYNIGPPKTTSSSDLIQRAAEWYNLERIIT